MDYLKRGLLSKPPFLLKNLLKSFKKVILVNPKISLKQKSSQLAAFLML